MYIKTVVINKIYKLYVVVKSMAYIVKQKINGKDYFYLRKSVRKGKKVTSQHVAYLGSNKEEAEKKYAEIIKNLDKKDIKMETRTKKN